VGNVTHYPCSSDRKTSLQMINVQELSNGLCCATPTAKHIQVVEVLEHAFLLFTLANLSHLLLDVANCLLGHDCVVALVDWHRTVVREDLRECRPGCVASTTAIHSHQVDPLVTHRREERLQTTCQVM
jgi:hypothetical protein